MLRQLIEPASEYMVREQFRTLASIMPFFYVALVLLDAAYTIFSATYRSPLQDALVVIVAVTAWSRARYWFKARRDIDAYDEAAMRAVLRRSIPVTVFLCLICVGATQNFASHMDNESKIFLAGVGLVTATAASVHISIVPRNAILAVVTTFGAIAALLLTWGSETMQRTVWLIGVLAAAQVMIVMRQYENLKEIIESRETLRVTQERLRAAEQAARAQAFTDALTGLLNRRHFDMLSRGSVPRLAVALIDLDGFKGVNDEHGHKAGDMLLKLVAGRLYEHLHHLGDVIRLGGDEFALVCSTEADFPLLQTALARAIDELGRPYVLTGAVATIGASAGICIGKPGQSLEAILAAADSALYEVKKSGKGFVRAATNTPQEAKKRAVA